MLASPINVEENDEVFPSLIERLQVGWNFFAVCELAVVGIDLILHPAQVLNRFSFAWIKSFDDGFALRFAKFARALFGAALNQTTIEGTSRHHRKIQSFSPHRQQQRRYVLKESGADREAGHPPKINRLFESFFYVPKIDLGEFHETVCALLNNY